MIWFHKLNNMTLNRKNQFLIIVLLNVFISSSLYAVKIAIVQYEIQDLNDNAQGLNDK